ncbi:FAD dependent oxidoreductase [Calycomorphotria hydatis]|uniref:FAD dependent oxidoreductase n=1 Tax=Calycomorphotria hydatis TaxID=2528027 RepID=A0A517TC23_9PLAN|nr:FAD dependent oxidoreductase [Calycomorphotria hydatis]
MTNLSQPVEQPDEELSGTIARRLGVPREELGTWRILKKSLDARQRSQLKYIYSVVVDVPEGTTSSKQHKATDIQQFAPPAFVEPDCGSKGLEHRPVVVGSGPAGLLAGYYLALRGFRPVIIERGQPVKERVSAIRSFDSGGEFEPENNYLFGEGGAGAFSDGKLTCRLTGPDVDYVLERFVDCGGPPSLVFEHRPHLGSNKLPMICRNFRRKIEALGGEYRFGTCLEGFDIREGKVEAIHTSSGTIPTRHVFLGIGHSARDTYEMLLAHGVPLERKAFQLGLRIEQPQETVNGHKYGREDYLQILGAADYSLVANGKKDLYTFCMCAGGWIIPSVSEEKHFCTNGMSNSRHDTPFANSGLVVTLEPHEFGSDHPLAGVEVQRKYEALAYELAGRNYSVPIQRAVDFVDGRAPNVNDQLECSYRRGASPMELMQVLPPIIGQAVRAGLPVMDAKWRGDFLKDAILVGPEMRGSSPVRIDRDHHTRQCPNIVGLYPIGEGAGYAGGIVTAAVDGLRSAKVLVANHAPIN